MTFAHVYSTIKMQILQVWQFGLAVTRWSRSNSLTYAEPG